MEKAIAGGALGLLTGILLGLSATGVVASVLSALLAMAAALLALTGAAEALAAKGAGARGPGHDRAVALFCACALLGLAAGLWTRTHGLLSPAPEDVAAEWRAAGLDDPAAARVAAWSLAGVALTPAGGVVAPDSARPFGAGVLFSGAAGGDCSVAEPRNADPAEVRIKWMSLSPPWPSLADALPAGEPATLAGVWRALCVE